MKYSQNVNIYLLIVLLMTTISAVNGQEFAIQNKVLNGKNVVSETRTIVTQDAYFDVMLDDGQPSKVSVYYPANRQFLLVSFIDKQQTTIGELDIREFLANLELRVAELNSLVQFALNPTFRESQEGNTIRLESPNWDYIVRIDDKQDPEVVNAFRQFADSFARLNAFWSLPPSARLELNEAIHRNKGIPLRVDVHIKGTADSPGIEQRTEHTYSWQLTASDKQIVESTDKGIREFKTISFAEFLNTTLAANNRVAKRR